MNKFVFHFSIFLFFFCSCSERNKSFKRDKNIDNVPFLFRMNAAFTDAEKYLSFPIWFNDSIIAKNKILKVTRSLYFLDKGETQGTEELINTVPREKREYWFHPNGQIKVFKMTYFFDDEEIGSVVYTYKTLKDKFGFAIVTKGDDLNPQFELEEEDIDFPFFVHQSAKQTGKYLAYQDVVSGDYLFYMLHKKYWGPLSVDSILKPTPKDNIVLGSPYFPFKQYKVENKVNEKDAHLFNYNAKTKGIRTIIKQDYPFDQNRTITYTEKGTCNGYIDSTFSGKLFLTRILTDFKLNKKNYQLK